MMNHLDELQVFKLPILLGTSRKSMIGLALSQPVDKRVEGTIATTTFGYVQGCRLFRVHDIKENYLALKMIEAIKNGG
jgi:dihydropteroate synthase